MPQAEYLALFVKPEDLHEYVSFDDRHEARTWVFDVTFLTSNWTCIFGRGCKGVFEEDTTELSQGCCSHGAHLADDADLEKLRVHAKRLTPGQWQHHSAAKSGRLTAKDEDGVQVTRIVDGACIFLNRPDFPGGAGCALHRAALEAGERPLDWKPDVCWQLPLRRSDDTDSYGHVTSTVREWKRRDWGEAGDGFHWWCTDAPDAFIDAKPVWKTMRDEISEMVGDEVYGDLADFLRARTKKLAKASLPKKSNVTFLPHPALRSKRR